ncbi:MAG: DUF4114 domain-containing protein [Sphaerospermopsis sp. SIO1G1]|nr:DUF4114 domain-containing protein [Sphaerospermopsis sp. SIO1G1]
MENLTPGSVEYIQEAANRVISNSNLGYIVIRDPSEGARFNGELGESNKNQGDYLGVQTYNFTPGVRVAMMLVPQGTIQEVVNNPNLGGNKRPLFSISEANPNNAVQLGELVSGTFGWEDLRNDGNTDTDYNDIIFQVQGLTGGVTDLNQVINPNRDWTNTSLGQEIITFASETDNLDLTSPEITASLFDDSGLSNGDNITNNARIVGQLTDASDIVSFQAKLNNGNLVDILSELNEDGSFDLDEDQLTEINGGQLADGSYQLTLQAEDIFGNLSEEFNFSFTLDNTNPETPNQLAIQNDSDLVTNNNIPTFVGESESGTTVRLFNGDTQLGEAIAVNGVWEITSTTSLTEGVNNLIFNSIDAAGNVSDSAGLEITVDTTAPEINITNPQENAEITNGARLQGSVNETGTNISQLSYRFGDGSEINVPINEAGEFDVELDLTDLSGEQNLILNTVDVAGNSSETTQIVIVTQPTTDTTAPTITATLNNDTGINTDNITSDATISGTVNDNSNITSFQAKLNDGEFVDVLSSLQNGNFTFNETLLNQINSGELADGNYQITLQAEDEFGNLSNQVTVAFTLDKTNPTWECS